MYAFLLGREQKIALKELESVLRSLCFDFERINPDKNVETTSILSVDKNIVLFNIKNSKPIEVSRLMKRLGGTIKIYKIRSFRDKNIKTQIVDIISKQKKDGKLKYAISNYSEKPLFKNLGFEIKKVLSRRKISSRFVQEKEGEALSSAESFNGIFNKDGVEVGVFDDYVGILIAVTNPNEWSKRDYGKPKGDRFSGMIPPKLARMMINIAIGDEFQISNDKNKDSIIENCELKIGNSNDVVIFDPFCGSGNILLEAMVLDLDVAGSDISERAVFDTKENLKWLSRIYKIQIDSIDKKIQKADATNAQYLASDVETVVVAEPYLGTPKKQTVGEDEATKELSNIKKLYTGFLKNIYSQKEKMNLKRVCLVFPTYELQNKESRSLFEEIVDEIEKLGYTISCSLRYGRDYQVVKREIVVLSI